MARKPDSVETPLPSVIVANYNNVLNTVDQAMQIVSEALLQQMLTVRGQRRKDIKAHDLAIITKALLAIKLVYKMERPIVPPDDPKRRQSPRQGSATYEEWIRENTAEAETKPQ